MKNLTLLLLTLLVLTSCSRDLFNFTIVSTKNINLEKLSSLEKSTEKTKGEDKTSIIIIIPTKRIKIDKAISNTIDKIPGCVALLDGKVYTKFWYIPYIYGQQRIVIEATPLLDPSIAKSLQSLPKYGKIYLDKKGEIKSVKSISQLEFSVEKNKF
ncbi:hypothetical protein [Flavobacterium hiemivividum]|uniref:Lipoprotein n=1 Tax=Flavobacterium hiemivividum TaxID=2541734 RepID=A0A4R5D2K6_9FLAO|nr:hypothetical protein [Flavobacterium hiemivividum]TDE06050.1 hypothetical protein E0F98_00015 [Flavobacterium hiemivividum]